MNNNRVKMITGFAFTAFVLVSILVIWSIVSIAHALFINSAITGVAWKFDLLMDMPFRLGTSAILILVAFMLLAFYKQEKPFTSANAKRLKCVAVLMMFIEPAQYILNTILNHFRPLAEDGLKITYVISFGGVWFAIGLAVWCMSQTFQYGIRLQSESDETL